MSKSTDTMINAEIHVCNVSDKDNIDVLVAKTSEDLLQQVTYLNKDAYIGGDDFSIYSISFDTPSFVSKDDEVVINVPLQVHHNLSDDDFSCDEMPVTISHKSAKRMISFRLNEHINHARINGAFHQAETEISVEKIVFNVI